jgi:hypothetical protein
MVHHTSKSTSHVVAFPLETSKPLVHPFEKTTWSPDFQLNNALRQFMYRRSQSKFVSSQTSPFRSMRDAPSNDCSPQVKRLRRRKVRFALIDKVRSYETHDTELRQDLWWSKSELADIRYEERIHARCDAAAQKYVQAYIGAFHEINMGQSIASEKIMLALMDGCDLGYSGLMNTISREWQCTRKLDVQCAVAAVVAFHQRALLYAPPDMDVSSSVRAHSKALTRSHRKMAQLLGEANNNALQIDNCEC